MTPLTPGNRIEESIEIARTPDFVWAFLADPLNDPRWCPKVKSVQPIADRRWRVVHKPVPFRRPMELTVEHVELRPPKSLTLREEDEASVFDVEYRVDQSGDGTRFTQISSFAWKGLPRVLHGTFARGVRRDLRAQLKALKRLLEADGPDRQPGTGPAGGRRN
jgi:carbon monoxide dehydrogenase subunit G